MTTFTVQVANAPSLYVQGMIPSNNATTPNTLLDVSAGICRDQSNAHDLNLGNFNQAIPSQSANVVTTLDISVNGVNGLDTGTIAASTVYKVFVIADTNTSNPTALIASTASIPPGPLMPFGYDAFRLIGYFATDASSHILPFFYTAGPGSSGNTSYRCVMYSTPQATDISAGASSTYANVSTGSLVPPSDNLLVIVNTAFTPSAASQVLAMQGRGAAGDQVVITSQVNGVVLTNQSLVATPLATFTKIRYKVSGGAVAINVAGYFHSV